ncbi:unnamed protein product [Ranitomeya imitator]|uniref:Uncharacterized protein n=1 Tax=Ranitomeya imitator TaxID=111125 RepID=A0ABN9MLC0_9NEOB|nr:unnamed protein product [Ranitomeya imitator]
MEKTRQVNNSIRKNVNSMMKSRYREQLTDFSPHSTDCVPFNGKIWKPGVHESKVDVLEEELRRGYRQEALTLSAVMENMTRLYLTRWYKVLEKELKSTKMDMEVAEKQQMEAQRVQSELLHHNGDLLRKLKKLRQTIEEQQDRKISRLQTQPEITHWKLVTLKDG